MSTRCRIGIENNDKTVTSIYCHHDGYLEGGVGERLIVHYQDEKKIRDLMKLGDMSSLGTEPVSNPNAWKTPRFSANWIEDYNKLHPENMCDTYASRNEVAPARTLTLADTVKRFNNSDQEYLYLFRGGKWYYIECGENSKNFRLVEKEIG